VTRRVRLRVPEKVGSMTLVEQSPRHKVGGNPRRLTVNISAKPSRRLAAAEGYSPASRCASCSSRACLSRAGLRPATGDPTAAPRLPGRRASRSGRPPGDLDQLVDGRPRLHHQFGHRQQELPFLLKKLGQSLGSVAVSLGGCPKTGV